MKGLIVTKEHAIQAIALLEKVIKTLTLYVECGSLSKACNSTNMHRNDVLKVLNIVSQKEIAKMPMLFSSEEAFYLFVFGYNENASYDELCYNASLLMPLNASECIENALDTLNAREKDCIKMYALEGRSMEDIAKKYTITRERIRQIITHGIHCLRHPSRRTLLRLGNDEENQFLELYLTPYKKQIAQEYSDKYNQYWKHVYQSQYENITNPTAATKNTLGDFTDDLTQQPITVLELSTRAYHCLMRAGIHTVKQLIALTPHEVKKIRNMGQHTMDEIQTILSDFGLSLTEPYYESQCTDDLTKQPITVLELSTRAYNCLIRAGIHTIQQLIDLTPNEVKKIRNMGQHTMDEIQANLSDFGLSLTEPHYESQ